MSTLILRAIKHSNFSSAGMVFSWTAAAVLVLTVQTGQASDTFNFLIHGDWGYPDRHILIDLFLHSYGHRSRLENQTLVARQMGVVGEIIDAEFVIALGRSIVKILIV